VKKVERKMGPFGEAFEEAVRLARRIAGMKDTAPDSEVIWADPQTQSEAVLTDATIKQFAAGLIPVDAALEKLGYTPQQIERYRAMRTQDQLLGAAFNPPPTPPVEPTQSQTPPIVA
jgi:hypothetical protein